jgi:hypothetical protein
VATDTELEQRVVQLDERLRKPPRKSLINGRRKAKAKDIPDASVVEAEIARLAK